VRHPLFATVGLKEPPIRPLAVEDLVPVLAAAMADGRLVHETVAVTGPETLSLAEGARRVAGVLGRTVVIARAPVWVHTSSSPGSSSAR
jgi:NADH dehydrogenase